jgi:serine/threonine protein kinase
MAPEIIMNRPYDSFVDIWSIGIIMYILESGGCHPLYNSYLGSKNFINFIKNKRIINFPDFFPSVARNFFLKLCKYEPFFRYNVIKALSHPWIIRTNHKIPLTIFEDVEKEDKIKNFKNMMLTLIYLKQLKYLFKRNNKRAKTINVSLKPKYSFYKYKLMPPIFNVDKNIFSFRSIKFTPSKDNDTNLPPIFKSNLQKLKNELFTAKIKNPLSFMSQDLKPIKLFIKENKNYNISRYKYNASLINRKNKINSLRNSSIKINISINNGSNLEQNSLNSINRYNSSLIEGGVKNYKDKEKNKYRLYSSKKLNLKKIL